MSKSETQPPDWKKIEKQLRQEQDRIFDDYDKSTYLAKAMGWEVRLRTRDHRSSQSKDIYEFMLPNDIQPIHVLRTYGRKKWYMNLYRGTNMAIMWHVLKWACVNHYKRMWSFLNLFNVWWLIFLSDPLDAQRALLDKIFEIVSDNEETA